MRCYGFSGRNSGYFNKKLNYKLDIDDFRDFVNKYPSGCHDDWPIHQTIDEFMKKKHMSKVNLNISRDDDKQQAALNSFGILTNNENKKQGNSEISGKTSIDSEDMEGTIIAVLASIVGMIFIISVIKYVIDHVPLLSYVYAETGLLGICSLVCMLGSVFLFIISFVLKKLRKFFKVIVLMFAVGLLFAQILDGEIKGGIISVCVAVVGYEFGLWLDKK